MPYVCIFLYWVFSVAIFAAFLAVDSEMSVIDLILTLCHAFVSLVVALALMLLEGLTRKQGP